MRRARQRSAAFVLTIHHLKPDKALALIEQFLKQGVLSEMERWEPTEGTPQGGVISPLLSNIYLNRLDHLMAGLGFEMVPGTDAQRWSADDFVILCRTQEEAERALDKVRKWTTENGLTLHPEKTHIADTQGDGFEFLGALSRLGIGPVLERTRSVVAPDNFINA